MFKFKSLWDAWIWTNDKTKPPNWPSTSGDNAAWYICHRKFVVLSISEKIWLNEENACVFHVVKMDQAWNFYSKWSGLKHQHAEVHAASKATLVESQCVFGRGREATLWQASSKSTWLRSKKLDFSSFEKVESCPILFPFLHFDVKSMGCTTSSATTSMVSSEMRKQNDDKPILPSTCSFLWRYFGGVVELIKHIKQMCHIIWFPLRIVAEILGRALKQNIGRSWLSWPQTLSCLPCMVYNVYVKL